MRRLGRPLQTRMGLNVEIKRKGMGDASIHHSPCRISVSPALSEREGLTRRQVATFIIFAVLSGEEPHMVLD